MTTASTSPSTRQLRVMTARARNEGGERATSFRAENRLRRVVAPVCACAPGGATTTTQRSQSALRHGRTHAVRH
jgi:hypothetical protein